MATPGPMCIGVDCVMGIPAVLVIPGTPAVVMLAVPGAVPTPCPCTLLASLGTGAPKPEVVAIPGISGTPCIGEGNPYIGGGG